MDPAHRAASKYGTYIEATGAKADFAEAMTTWVPVAHALLVETARSYNRTTTYKELTDLVQTRSGIRTKMLIGHWSGRLLEAVAVRSADAGEPPLTSLCVHQDGTVGEGYRSAPKSVESNPASDVDDLAAAHRLLCYRRYATDLPADGGVPTLTQKVAATRSKRTKDTERRRAVCSVHFMELSATGVCPECD